MTVPKNRVSSLIAVMMLLLSSHAATATTITLGTAADYALLGLQNGNVTVNSATLVSGDFGYSAGVTSTTNQKIGEAFVGEWTGTAYVHSTANFAYENKNYKPTGGIVTSPLTDARLNQANIDAMNAWATVSALPPTITLGAINDTSVSLGATDGQPTINVVQIASLNMNSDLLSLTGDPDDYFVLNIMGNFEFSQSEVRLLGGLPVDRVLFNFPAAGAQTKDVLINKNSTVFNGTILAPDLDGFEVEYHNPATFNGAIIAKNINVHSDFNLHHQGLTPVPEPSTLLLLALGLLAVYPCARKEIEKNYREK